VGHCIHISRNTMNYKQISIPSPHPRQLFMEWYHSTPSGQKLRDSEASYLLNSLQLTYYQRILQVGRLGMERQYIVGEFSRNFALVTDEATAGPSGTNSVMATMRDWPIASESMDILILPHLIEFETDPHRVLNEAERVLKPEGRLFIFGFNPWNLQGLLPSRGQSPSDWNTRFVGCFQIMEWLNLLKFEAEFSAGFGFSSFRPFFEPQPAWQKPIAYLNAAYAVKAIKRTWIPIPMKQAWLSAPELLPGQVMAPPLMRKQGKQ